MNSTNAKLRRLPLIWKARSLIGRILWNSILWKNHNSTWDDLGMHFCCCIWLHSEYSSSYWFQKSNKTNAWLCQRRDGNLLHLKDKGMDWLIHILICLTKCFMWTMPTLKSGRKNPAEFISITYLNHLSKLGWIFFSSLWVALSDEPASLADWSSHPTWQNWSKPQLCSNIFSRHDCLQSKHLPITLL